MDDNKKMKITDHASPLFTSQLQPVQKEEQTQTVSTPLMDNTNQTNGHDTTRISLSSTATLYQSIDALSQQVDDVYLAHMSADEREQIKSAYQQLDEIFENGDFSEQQLDSADKIFDKIDQIYTRTEQKFSDSDWHTLESTEAALDKAFEQLEQQENVVYAQIDTLDEEQMSIIATQLDALQKDRLTSLNEQLGNLIDKEVLDEDQETRVSALFEQIEQLNNKAFERLTPEQQERVSSINDKIDKLFEQLYS
ncbi:hypothetical protein [Thalassotalea fusca]